MAQAYKAAFVFGGDNVDYVPSADVAAGDIVAQGRLAGVAKTPILNGRLGALAVRGVFDVVKKEEAMVAGDDVFWDAAGDPYNGTSGTGCATLTGGSNPAIGRVLEDAASTDEVARVLFVQDVEGGEPHDSFFDVEDLAAGADISARPIFVSSKAVELISVGILTQGAPAGIDDSNTAVIALKDDAGNTIVSKTYNTATQPPSSDYEDIGTLDATHKILAAAEHVTLDVTQGTSADLPAFTIIIRWR